MKCILKGIKDSAPLYYAARDGNLATVRELLQNGADVEQTLHGASALFAASHRGHEEIVKACCVIRVITIAPAVRAVSCCKY